MYNFLSITMASSMFPLSGLHHTAHRCWFASRGLGRTRAELEQDWWWKYCLRLSQKTHYFTIRFLSPSACTFCLDEDIHKTLTTVDTIWKWSKMPLKHISTVGMVICAATLEQPAGVSSVSVSWPGLGHGLPSWPSLSVVIIELFRLLTARLTKQSRCNVS